MFRQIRGSAFRMRCFAFYIVRGWKHFIGCIDVAGEFLRRLSLAIR